MESLAVHCAWCDRVRSDEGWTEVPLPVVLAAEAAGRFTSGICPECFSELAPDVRYPPS